MLVKVTLAALSLVLACSCTKKSDSMPGPGTPLNTGAGGSSAGGSVTAGGSPGSGTPTGAGGAGTAGGGVACGSKTCAAGQICCNASCGICTPPDGFCTQQLCTDGDAGPPSTPPAGGGATCKADSDCRLFSDYCTGCDCRALGPNEKNPTCSGPGVRCLVDPCDRKIAACQNGRCVAVLANRR